MPLSLEFDNNECDTSGGGGGNDDGGGRESDGGVGCGRGDDSDERLQ